MQGLKRFLWEPYVRALDKNPLVVKCCTAGVLMGVGDGVSQGIEGFLQKRSGNQPEKYDYARTARMGAIGLFMSGPLMHLWYKVLDRWFVGPVTRSSTLKKIAADQLLYTPISLAGFLTVLPILEGKPLSAVKDRMKSDYTPILLTNWTVWPGAQYINFQYIPTNQRVLYVTTLGIVWNSFLSYMGNRNAKAKTTNSNSNESENENSNSNAVEAKPVGAARV